MRNRPAHLLLCGAFLLGGLAACGADDAGDGVTTDDTVEDGAGEGGGGGQFDFDNEVLSDFCNDVADYIVDARAVLEDPDDVDAVAELQARGQELSTRGEELQADLSPGDVADLEECSQVLQAGGG